MNDYSQYGEGKVINHYFQNKTGTCVSLGENDGKTLSNVLGLIEMGFKAHLVEPSNEAFAKLKELHKDNKNVWLYNYAIGKHNGEATFYHSGTHLNTGDTSLLSTIDKDELIRWGKSCEFTETITQVKTWNNFLLDSLLTEIDFISIDCEGVDFEILQQIRFDKLNIKMLCIEYNNVEESKFTNHMKQYGYKLHYKNYCNLIFVK